MNPRDDDKGNFDDTEFPNDKDDQQESADSKHSDPKFRGGTAEDEGDFDDKNQ